MIPQHSNPTRRRWRGVALAVAAALAIAACGGDDNTAVDEPAADEPTSDEPAAEEPAAEEPAAEEAGGTLRFQTFQGPDQVAAWETQFASFGGGDVEIESVPQMQQSERLLTLAAADDLPDVGMISARWFPALASRGLLEPIDQSVFDQLQIDDLHEVLLDAYSWDGQLYGVPTDLDVGMLFYNKTMFAEAGVAEPTPDWTWDDFRTAAAALTSGEGPTKKYGADVSGYPTLTAMANTLGGSLIDPATGPTVTEGGGYDALALYQAMVVEDESVPPPGTENSAINSGNVAMGIYGPWAAFYFLSDVPFEWGVTSLPQDGVDTTFGWGSTMVVFADSEQKQAAFDFIEFFLSDELMTQRATDWAWTPPSKSLLGDETFGTSDALAMTADQKALVLESVSTAQAPVLLPEQVKIEDGLTQALSSLASGTSLDDVVASLTDTWTPLVEG